MGNDNIFRFILIRGFAVVFPIGMYHRGAQPKYLQR